MHSISDSVLPDGVAAIDLPSPSLQTAVKKDLSAISVARASFVNHRSTTRRSDNVVRYDGSSNVEAVYSPRYRELRCERELKRLQCQQSEAEEQLVRMESELRESKCKVETLREEVATKKARIRDMEVNEKLYQRTLEEMETKSAMMSKQLEQLQRHYEIQKERLITYKASEEKWEETRAALDEALYSRNNTVVLLERELRDVKDELASSLETIKNAELDISRMRRENEEFKRVAELERKDYQASIADWRSRFEKAEAENLTTSAATVERNAMMVLEMREKSEEAQRLQNLLEEEKKKTHECEEELSRAFQEKALALESVIADGQQTINDLKDQLVGLTKEKNIIEAEKMKIGKEIEAKTEALREALLIIDGMQDEISSLARNCLNEQDQSGNEVDGDKSNVYDKLLHVISVVETYCKQFENLELRLSNDDHRKGRDTQNTDLTETISDLQYRLFAADQRQVAYEKERMEIEYCMKQLQDSTNIAINENANLKNQISNLLAQSAKLNEENKKMQETISELNAEILSKSHKINQISEVLEESISANVRHAEVLSNMENNYIAELESTKSNELLYMQQCEELRLKVLKKDEEVKMLTDKISQLKLTLDSINQNGNIQSKVQEENGGSPNSCDGVINSSQQKGDDSSNDYEDTSEDIFMQNNTARKFLDLTSISKIRKLRAESTLGH